MSEELSCADVSGYAVSFERIQTLKRTKMLHKYCMK